MEQQVWLPLCCVLLQIYPTSTTKDIVSIKPQGSIKYFDLPTSNEPVVSWMDIQRGIYPNTTMIQSMVKVGEPITLFIYLKDNSGLYDLEVTDCWAYDDQQFLRAKNRLHLTGERAKRSGKLIGKWNKYNLPRGGPLNAFLYAQMLSFKFPENDQVYITCDIQLCFKDCNRNS